MCVRHGASRYQEGLANGRTPRQIGVATAGTARRRGRAWCRARRRRLCPVAGGIRPDALAGRASRRADRLRWPARRWRSEEHTSELQSLMRTSYAVFCLKKKKYTKREFMTSQQHKNHSNYYMITHNIITTDIV